jgi:ubiquinone/menaquinone biosynthesis C-methylase UbiE
MASLQREKVQEHYRDLAESYGARSNQTCARIFEGLVQRCLHGCPRVLELGSGCSEMLNGVCGEFGVACDLSIDMLRARPTRAGVHCVVTPGEHLPFKDESFRGVLNINVLEHVSDVDAVLRECSRVLQKDGSLLAITPNGNWEYWLNLAERWSLKIPEGPHTFLTTRQLRQLTKKYFDIVEHRTFCLLPVGRPGLARLIDRVALCSTFGWGFFQYMLAKK